jgi:prenyltransferase beta subunit
MDRGESPDLYYSVFGIDALLALDESLPLDRLLPYLQSHGDGAALDFMHLTCLARCWARMPDTAIPGDVQSNVLAHIESYRTANGGYHTVRDADSGSVTGIYLAFAAYQDMQRDVPDPQRVLASLESLRTPDGGYANEPGMAAGTTLSTAGTLILQHSLGAPPDTAAADWLWRQTGPTGGFLASPATPMPDLLSTATAVYAARVLERDVDTLRDGSVIFTESLQDDTGGYAGHWLESRPDCEYTFYALLVLGCLMGDSGIDSSEFMP